MWTGNKTVFRTYFHGKVDKDGTTSPAEKVKGMPGHAWNEVCNDNSFGAVLNDGYVDISFDSDELSQAFWDMAEQNDWKCLILENPENGHIHSYWKKPEGVFQKDGRDKKLAVGLIADIHSKETYIRLRTNGVDRFPPSFEPDEIQEVPEELYPVDSNIDLYVVGMFHDLCKCDNYVLMPDEETDKEHWEYNNASVLTGHGEKSVIMLQQLMPLTLEEVMCIRWHMGAFDDKSHWNNYGQAVTQFNNVLYSHMADMMAARIFGV